eukprot:8895510-Lingulodinium_polyedra.AAC.1
MQSNHFRRWVAKHPLQAALKESQWRIGQGSSGTEQKPFEKTTQTHHNRKYDEVEQPRVAALKSV